MSMEQVYWLGGEGVGGCIHGPQVQVLSFPCIIAGDETYLLLFGDLQVIEMVRIYEFNYRKLLASILRELAAKLNNPYFLLSS